MDYRFTKRDVHTVYDDDHWTDACLICIRREDGIVFIHPFSEYILKKHRNDTLKSQQNIAGAICRFLNFIREQGVIDLSDLTVGDISLYLNTLAYEGVKHDSIIQAEHHLTRFIYYLAVEMQILPKVGSENFVHTDGRALKLSLDVAYPRKKAISKVKAIRSEYMLLFFRVAVRYAPEIAFGIVLQFCGGLRTGEVVNLTKSAVRTIGAYGYDGWLLDIDLRPLRGDITTGGVKRSRKQRVYSIGQVGADIYKMHMDRYTSPPESDILFTNARGKAMSAKSYSRYFGKVKQAFIEILKNSDEIEDVIYAQELSEMKWATHIGRGTFSNQRTKTTSNPLAVAADRGDRNPLSAMPYIANSDAQKQQNREILQYITEEALQKGKLIDE